MAQHHTRTNGVGPARLSGPGGMTVGFERFDPVSAERALATNTVHQRSLRRYLVTKYAAMQVNGTFVDFAPDPIIFNTKGQLSNGQHRLRAVIISGKTVGFMVVRNCPDEMQFVIDQGRARTFADLLQVETGLKTTQHEGAVVKIMLNGYGGIFFNNRQDKVLSGLDLVAFYEKHKDQLSQVRHWFDRYPRVRFIRRAVVEGVILRAYCHDQRDHQRLEAFVRTICTGEYSGRRSEIAAVACRNYLLDINKKAQTNLSSGWAGQRQRYACTEYCLKAYLEKRPIDEVEETKVELFPLPHDNIVHLNVTVPVANGRGEATLTAN